MIIIVLVSAILYMMAGIMIYTNLYAFEKSKKIKFILWGLFIIFILSVVLVMISSIGIRVEISSYITTTKITSILLFSPINSILVLPYIANIRNKYKQKILKDVQVRKRIIIFFILVLIGIVIEMNYIQNFEIGLLKSVKK